MRRRKCFRFRGRSLPSCIRSRRCAQARGYQMLFQHLEDWLAEITGFAGISLQPNAGSQGEYAGLLVIHKYHESRGEAHRNVCLIPTSAHGTNPASAVMAGMKVVAVACDEQGNIDVADLRAKAEAHKDDLAALMVTYPSTHGVFEETIKEICEIVHAQRRAGLYGRREHERASRALPARRHRRGCLPSESAQDLLHSARRRRAGHGADWRGGTSGAVSAGPSGGRIWAAKIRIGAVSAAPWGSASILPISWVYIALMGGGGLTEATKVAILNANYIARRLEPYFPVLYKGKGDLVAHECILDLRQFKSVTVEDVAKRLMDYGFHAPTISWPVPGTMMVEPTESESKEELDRFCEAMIGIHAEIKAIESGEADKQEQSAQKRAAYRGRARGGQMGPSLFARTGRLSRRSGCTNTNSGRRRPHRQRLRRPQPGLFVRGDGELFVRSLGSAESRPHRPQENVAQSARGQRGTSSKFRPSNTREASISSSCPKNHLNSIATGKWSLPRIFGRMKDFPRRGRSDSEMRK